MTIENLMGSIFYKAEHTFIGEEFESSYQRSGGIFWKKNVDLFQYEGQLHTIQYKNFATKLPSS